MSRSTLAEELQVLRRQIALLRAREAELALALGSLPEEGRTRPGWRIRRRTAPGGPSPAH